MLHYNEVGAGAPHLPAGEEVTGSRCRTEAGKFAEGGRPSQADRGGGGIWSGFFSFLPLQESPRAFKLSQFSPVQLITIGCQRASRVTWRSCLLGGGCSEPC